MILSHGFAELPLVKGHQLESDAGEPPLSDALWSSRAKQQILESKHSDKIPSLQCDNIPIRFHVLSLFPTSFLLPPKHTWPGSRSFNRKRAGFVFWVDFD